MQDIVQALSCELNICWALSHQGLGDARTMTGERPEILHVVGMWRNEREGKIKGSSEFMSMARRTMKPFLGKERLGLGKEGDLC